MSPLSPAILYQEDFSNNTVDKDWIDKYGNNQYGYKQYEDEARYGHGHKHANSEEENTHTHRRRDRDHEDKEWFDTEQGMVYIGAGVAGLGAILIIMASLRKS